MRLALGERRRLALPRPLRRGQFRLEPIPLLLESVPLLAAVLRTLLQTRNLRVLLLDVSSQPADLGLQVFDPFPHGQAEHSHPRYDSRGDGFCPVAFDGVPVSAASDPLNNYVVLVMLLLGPHVGKFAVLSLPPRTTSVLPLMPVQHATTDAAARPAGRRSMSPEALPPMTAWRLWSIETVPGAADGSGGASRLRGRWRVLTRHRRSGGEHQDQTKEISDDQALQGRPGSVKMQWPRRRELLPFRNSL